MESELRGWEGDRDRAIEGCGFVLIYIYIYTHVGRCLYWLSIYW
jgi:hypothetical protein